MNDVRCYVIDVDMKRRKYWIKESVHDFEAYGECGLHASLDGWRLVVDNTITGEEYMSCDVRSLLSWWGNLSHVVWLSCGERYVNLEYYVWKKGYDEKYLMWSSYGITFDDVLKKEHYEKEKFCIVYYPLRRCFHVQGNTTRWKYVGNLVFSVLNRMYSGIKWYVNSDGKKSMGYYKDVLICEYDEKRIPCGLRDIIDVLEYVFGVCDKIESVEKCEGDFPFYERCLRVE